jgi:formylglycine-generating enzyme required for sulfatase activity
MYFVNYGECLEFCSKLNKLLSNQLPKGFSFGLPTEAQWEYAARGGKNSSGYEFSGSNNIDEVAWYDENSSKMTRKAGLKKENEIGIFDMSGNIFEWCLDWYNDSYYSISPIIHPTGVNSGFCRVLRGGSWNCKAAHCRLSFRHCTSPSNRSFDVGFRIILAN